MRIITVVNILAFATAIVCVPFTHETSLAVRRSTDIVEKISSMPDTLNLDRRTPPLSNGAVYSACPGQYCHVADMRTLTDWPHLVTSADSIATIGSVIMNNLYRIIGQNPNSPSYQAVIDTGLAGGRIMVQLVRGVSSTQILGSTMAALMHDSIQRMYLDRVGGIYFRVLDEVAGIIWTVQLMRTS